MVAPGVGADEVAALKETLALGAFGVDGENVKSALLPLPTTMTVDPDPLLLFASVATAVIVYVPAFW